VPSIREAAGGALQHEARGEHREDILRLARGGLLNLAGAASFGLLGFALTVMVSRALSSEGVGIFFEFVALYTFSVTLANLGTSIGLMRAVARARALGRTAELRPLLFVSLAPTVGASCVIAVLLFAYAPDLAELFLDQAHREVGVTYLRVAAPTLPFAAMVMGVLAATRGFGTMLPFNVIENFGQPSLRLMLGAGLFFGLANAWYPALVWAGPSVLALVVALLWLRFLLSSTSPRSLVVEAVPRAPVAREFWAFTSMRFGAAVLEVLLAWMGVLLLGALNSTEDAGIFAAASRYLLAGMLVNAAIFGVIGPHVGELLAVEDRARVRNVYQTATVWLVLVTFPVYLLMAVFAPVLMSAFGPNFVDGADALAILALGMLITMTVGPISALLLMGGRSSWNLFNTAAALAVNVGLSVVLIPPLGMVGAAISSVATLLVLNGLLVAQGLVLWRVHPVGPQYIQAMLAAGLCFGVLALGVRFTLGASVGSLILAALAGVPIYGTYIHLRREALRLPTSSELVSSILRRDRGLGPALPSASEIATEGQRRP